MLDAMTYGPLGLRMPDWVFYDCAVVPEQSLDLQPAETWNPGCVQVWNYQMTTMALFLFLCLSRFDPEPSADRLHALFHQ